MSDFVPVEGSDDLVRDPHTDQIINTNRNAYQEYVNRREKRKLEKEKSLNIEEDLANVKSEMNEIKSLLRELVNGD